MMHMPLLYIIQMDWNDVHVYVYIQSATCKLLTTKHASTTSMNTTQNKLSHFCLCRVITSPQ